MRTSRDEWRARFKVLRRRKNRLQDVGRPKERLSLDAHATTAPDMAPFVVRLTPHALQPTAAIHVADDARRLAAQRPEENHWLSYKSAQEMLRRERRPALLSYVAELLVRLVGDVCAACGGSLALDARRCGAEYWVQQRAVDEPINFHFDKDEALLDATDAMVHPTIATILYLSHGGAPTAIFDVRRSMDDEGQVQIGDKRRSIEVEGAPRRAMAVLSYPRLGKLVAFSGSLLHGVPGGLDDGAPRGLDDSAPRGLDDDASAGVAATAAVVPPRRLTLLVNIWTHHKPLCVRPLPEADASRLPVREACQLLETGERALEGLPPCPPPMHELRLQTGAPGLIVGLDAARRVVGGSQEEQEVYRGTLRLLGVPYSAAAMAE